MDITHEYAQDIVDKTMKILGKNINIMNSKGIIVGSGDKKRISNYHQGAEKVIKSGKPLEISSDDVQGLEGSKPGVNLPIYLNEKLVGVVGITGEPEEVRPFGQLLKMSVETMLTQAFLAEQLNMERNAKEFFVDDIISGKFESMDRLLSRGKVLGYDMNLKRVSLVLRLYDFKEDCLRKVDDDDQYIHLQRRRELALRAIRNCFFDPQNLISYKGSDDIVILYKIDSSNYVDFKNEIIEDVKILEKEMKRLKLGFCIGIGSLYSGFDGLEKSYKEAVMAIKIREVTNGKHKRNCLVFAWELCLEMLIYSVPESIAETYKKQVITKNSYKNFISNRKLVSTLKIFFESNLNTSCAAKLLNITRNTINNRLEKIKELTGLDPKIFDDAVRLKILMLMK